LSKARIGVVALVAVAFVVGAILGGRVESVREVIDDAFGGANQDASAEALEVIEENYFEQPLLRPGRLRALQGGDRGELLRRGDERHRGEARAAGGDRVR
jgi:hypothetical protein